MVSDMSYTGIYAFGANINAYNSIFASCSNALVTLYKGGEYNFHHSTFANFNRHGSSSKASLILSNYGIIPHYYDPINNTFREVWFGGDLIAANFYNSIFYGNNKSEIVLSDNERRPFEYYFENSLLKIEVDSFETDDNEFFNNCYYNEEPGFVNIDSLYFMPDTNAFIIDKANAERNAGIQQLENDYYGTSRLSNEMPDIGAIERY